MQIARVTGTVVSTIHHPVRDGKRLLVCEYVDEKLEPTGGYTLAIPAVDAGVGQTVLVLDEGNSSRQILADDGAPVRAMVVGIVDSVGVSASARASDGGGGESSPDVAD